MNHARHRAQRAKDATSAKAGEATAVNGRPPEEFPDAAMDLDAVLPAVSARKQELDDMSGMKLGHNSDRRSPSALSTRDRRNFSLLCLLYLLQGIPVGLAFGSVPFLLKSSLSYGQVGVFSLASYPYSLKLLWSPVIDALYTNRLGRRKSWIIPIQTLSAILLLWLGRNVGRLMADAEYYLYTITTCFFLLVLLCATQDIAVDGWALTLLSADNLSYASTAQTVGLNTGYFLSFTVFLAFYSPELSNKYLRSTPKDVGLISFGGYLTFWGWSYLLVTLALFLFQKEPPTRKTQGLLSVYRSMGRILRLRHVQTFILVHLVAKVGFQANEAVTNLKLLEKGFSKEDLALTVLIDFPFEIFFGYIAAKWSAGGRPLRLWMLAFMGRLFSAFLAQLTVWAFPKSGHVGKAYFTVVICQHVFGSFMSTIQFVSINAFHTQISDPSIGGTYMTLLNTLSNLGGTWPRLFVMDGVDRFTRATCHIPTSSKSLPCGTEAGKAACMELDGTCHVAVDGYDVMNILCITLGAFLFIGVIRPAALRLQSLPIRAWRAE